MVRLLAAGVSNVEVAAELVVEEHGEAAPRAGDDQDGRPRPPPERWCGPTPTASCHPASSSPARTEERQRGGNVAARAHRGLEMPPGQGIRAEESAEGTSVVVRRTSMRGRGSTNNVTLTWRSPCRPSAPLRPSRRLLSPRRCAASTWHALPSPSSGPRSSRRPAPELPDAVQARFASTAPPGIRRA